MSDRELLEKAAKAAGMKWQSYHMSRGLCLEPPKGGMVITNMWNPLANDRDAFRLAVKLGMFGDTGMTFQFMEAKDCESTRRAIVCAAAEIEQKQ